MMIDLERLLRGRLLGNNYTQWVIALGLALVTLGGTWVLRRVIRRQAARLALTPEAEVLEVWVAVLSRTATPFLWVLAMFVGTLQLELGKRIERSCLTAITLAGFWQCGLWAVAGLRAVIDHRQRVATDRSAAGTFALVGFLGRVVVWVTVLVLSLDNLGINVTALIAGLGVGGIAVALAVQNVLGDLLASLSIALDRPFVVGDTLAVDEFIGTVEYIGIKSVRLRSLGGEQIILSNTDILKSRVRNYGRMLERRVLFHLALAPSATLSQLEQVPLLIQQVIANLPEVRFGRAHFCRITDIGFEVEVVFFVLRPDYELYMEAQQSVHLGIVDGLRRESIPLAFPVRLPSRDLV